MNSFRIYTLTMNTQGAHETETAVVGVKSLHMKSAAYETAYESCYRKC